MIRHLAAAAAVVCITAGVRADDAAFSDAEFVKKAASSGMKEVQMGKLGTTMAKSADVKKFAEMIVTDHTKANTELMAAAKTAGIAAPDAPAPEDQKEVDMMKEHKDADFDKHFAEHMVKSHEKGVALFTKASKEAKDPGLKAFAAKTLPTLQQHLDMAKKLQGGGR
jgi:putative membrane protein